MTRLHLIDRSSLDLYGVCSFDDKNNRILSNHYEASDDMTVEKCLSICRSKGYPYSGLEWSCECHCGHAPEEGFEWAWSSKCDDRCSGDSSQICGGSEAMSIWTTPPTDLFGYCMNDYPNNQRVLDDFSITGLKELTIATCSRICKDYNYFGLQDGDGCYCGNDDSKFIPVSPDECNQPCSGNKNEICGGSWRLSVYGPNVAIDTLPETPTGTTTTPPMTSNTVAPETSSPSNNTCQFDRDGDGAIFDTGEPYSGNMRHGYRNTRKRGECI